MYMACNGIFEASDINQTVFLSQIEGYMNLLPSWNFYSQASSPEDLNTRANSERHHMDSAQRCDPILIHFRQERVYSLSFEDLLQAQRHFVLEGP